MYTVSHDVFFSKCLILIGNPDETMNQHQQAAIFAATLYVVPTTIGNLEDITGWRCLSYNTLILSPLRIPVIPCVLLQHFSINARLFALHDHNEQQKVDVL